MGLIEKWNNFAKKSIYINHSFEIGCGRLVFSGIIFSIQVTWGVLAGGSVLQILPSMLTWFASFKQQQNK